MPFEDEDLHRAIIENIADRIAITVNTESVFVNKTYVAIHGLHKKLPRSYGTRFISSLFYKTERQ